ncbi:NTP transferase domain-containing protein [Candidatus Woesearchaeota archaeon]|nr:NTP transferase domain-containing protein [Candidatus Woesearchaeota archaeon]
MKAIILAAGYGKRMQSTLHQLESADPDLYERLRPEVDRKQKAFLQVDGRPVMDHVYESIRTIPQVDEVYVITNEFFKRDFEEWGKGKPVKVYSDGNNTYLKDKGAIESLLSALEQADPQDDVVICASDSIFRFDFRDVYRFFEEHGTCSVSYNEQESEMHRRGMAVLDASGRIIKFAEKPANPESTNAVLPVYFVSRQDVPVLRGYDLPNRENIGQIIPWLIDNGRSVFCYHINKPMEEVRIDLGNIQDYIRVR